LTVTGFERVVQRSKQDKKRIFPHNAGHSDRHRFQFAQQAQCANEERKTMATHSHNSEGANKDARDQCYASRVFKIRRVTQEHSNRLLCSRGGVTSKRQKLPVGLEHYQRVALLILRTSTEDKERGAHSLRGRFSFPERTCRNCWDCAEWNAIGLLSVIWYGHRWYGHRWKPRVGSDNS
jgi:hypothetical protein